ncbi:DegT/DnrJ/EryC1/StrS family aminotransferase [Erythrobacter sp. MTPC3]|uniref:DegT/DnrJ/EryC1/StrS family aminotransferase n=1 Tax=Erythrobacter sp. MTPC3 TaxID=3056564 RepID=UPI0036F1E397
MVQFKSISSASDLAINGAASAFEEPLHVGRPNIGDSTAFLDLAKEILDRRWLTNNGPVVQELENRIAKELGVKHCVAMCNGTVALEIMIRAVGLSGEVIVPSYTFIATVHALHWQAITPVFADIDAQTHTLDPVAVRRMITSRTTGILATHLWGRACHTQALQEIADEHGLSLIYDAAHSFLCSSGNTSIGGFGRAEAFSFHATKFFNTFEGGAVTTNDDELAAKMRLMRNFGFGGVDEVVYPGTNGKMSEICAAMGLVNLDQVEKVIEQNKVNYDAYREALEGIDGLSIFPLEKGASNFQYVVMEVDPAFPASRDAIVEALQAENILARRYFWPGCHNMRPYRDLFPHAGLLLPVSETVADRVIVLPTGTTLPEGATRIVRDVCRVLASQQFESAP